MSESDAPSAGDRSGEIIADAPSTALVEVEPGVAIVYGDQVPAGLDLVPLTLFDASSEASLTGAISKATGLANVGTQAVNGVMQAQGLVRLAPETVKLLQQAKAVTSGGWNLGGIVGSDGKILAQIRWLPATGAGVAAVAASVGPALAMVAMQFQLAEVSSLTKHNIELTRMALDEARMELRAKVNGDYEALTEMVGHARHIGSVSDAIFNEVQGSKRALDAHWIEVQGHLQNHVANLGSKRGHKERREYLLDNGEAILADAHALLLAQASWFMYQALWAGHLVNTAKTDPQDAALLHRVVDDARGLHAQSLSETDHLLDQLGREFTIMSELDGRRTFPLGGQRRASKDVARMARHLQESVAALRPQDVTLQQPEINRPTISVFQDGAPEVLRRVLPLRLEPKEQLVALASARTTAVFEISVPDTLLRGIRRRMRASERLAAIASDGHWVAVTDQRVLLMKPDDFRRLGVIEREIPVDHIRYVRTRSGDPDHGPVIDLIGKDKDEDLTFEFGSWAKAGERRQDAERFGDVLRGFMSIPANELAMARIPELEPPINAESTSE